MLFKNRSVSSSALNATPVFPLSSAAIVLRMGTWVENSIPEYLNFPGWSAWSFLRLFIPDAGYLAPPSVIKMNRTIALSMYLSAMVAAISKGSLKFVPPPLYAGWALTLAGSVFSQSKMALLSKIMVEILAFLFTSFLYILWIVCS